MNKKRNKIMIAIVFLLGGAGIIPKIYFTALQDTLAVEIAVPKEEAIRIVENEPDDYRIVSIDGWSTSLGAFIEYGEDKGIQVEITGEIPQEKYNSVLWDDNIFLIQVVREKNADKKGEDMYLEEERHYIIEAANPRIIAPIHRDYTYEQHFRMFYPKNYIDLYDLVHGDYEMLK